MAASIFSYGVQRPYPYGWFTPVAFIGGAILLVLFSLMNFVNNSYTLESQDRRDPNATVANGAWFTSWPSYLSRNVQPICQPQEMPINTQFFTNQTAFEYTLLAIEYSDLNPSSIGTAPSVSYMNNVLEECSVSVVQMNFAEDEPFNPLNKASWGGSVRTSANCHFGGAQGEALVYLTATYNPFTLYWIPGSSSFISSGPEKKAGLFWAEVLLNGFWKQVVANMSELAFENFDPIVSAAVYLWPKEWEDISSPNFFNVAPYFRAKNGSVITIAREDGEGSTTYEGLDMYLPSGTNLNKTWAAIDLLGKSMYSAVLADLGGASKNSQANLITNGTRLESLLYQAIVAGERDSSAELGFIPRISWSHRIQLADLSGDPPVITPSVISTNYRCQIPKLKSGGEIFISVLVADLVLLSAAWKLFTFGVGWLGLNKVPRANYCEGCLKVRVDDREEMEQLPKIARVSTLSVIESSRPSIGSRNDSQEYNQLRSQDDSEPAT